MAIVLTEEQGLLRDSARDFLADLAPVSALRALRDSGDADGFSRPLWKQFAEMGYTGMLVPEAHGGMGLGAVEAGVVMTEIGQRLSASPFLASSIVAATALLRGASPAQQAALLPAIGRGEKIAALACDEHTKHRPRHIALKATKQGEGWVLDGHKTFVVDGHAADQFIVAARSAGVAGDAAGITLFLVDRAAAGLAVERVAMVDARPTARLTFTQVAVDAAAVLGTAGDGAAALDEALDAGRAAVAAELLGIADEVFARTVAFLKERKQFDRLIGEFQGLQHRMAMLYCDIELARAAVLKAQQVLDADPAGAAQAVSVAKASAGDAANRAVQEAVQMHGGMGMTDAFEIGFFMKRARVLQELYGDSAFHADRLATLRGY